jgi:hypothetical protein
VQSSRSCLDQVLNEGLSADFNFRRPLPTFALVLLA